jgi:signal transduction histidine kinase
LVNQAVQNVPTAKLPQPWHETLAATLQALVGTVGNELAQPAQILLQGLEQVPSMWQRNVEHLLVSLVRNAIEHGIEPLYQRVADNKPAVGAIVVECSTTPGQGCTLSVRDDGRCIDPSLLAHYRIDAGSIELETASQQDTEAMLGIPASHSNDELLLTQARGLGLEFTRELLLRMHGSLQVSCKPKQWTLVQLHLPEAQAAPSSDAALAETQQVA